MPTDEQWSKLIRIVKRQQQSIDDLWTAVNDYHSTEAELTDEFRDKLDGEHRRVSRLTKRVEELEK
jgi:hypothetical protein